MPTLTSTFDTAIHTYRHNRTDQLAAVEALNQQPELVRAGCGSRYSERHRARGSLPVRERLELLLASESAFFELSPLTAWGTEFAAAAATAFRQGARRGVRGYKDGAHGTSSSGGEYC